MSTEHGSSRASAENEKSEELKALRQKLHKAMEQELVERLKINPHATEEELRIGALREMLEPQVRDVVFEFHRKGYTSESSGFTGDAKQQIIDGYFVLDDATVKAIQATGAHVLVKKVYLDSEVLETMIMFTPTSTRVEDIKAEWDRIAALLPDTGERGLPSVNGEPDAFTKVYGGDQHPEIIRARLERQLSLFKNHTDPRVVTELEEQLRQLKGK